MDYFLFYMVGFGKRRGHMEAIPHRVSRLVQSITEDYQLGRSIDKRDFPRHPDKDSTIYLTGKLLGIIFPGYFGGGSPGDIEDALYQLYRQISSVLDGPDAITRSRQLSFDFFSQIPDIRVLAQTDVEAAFDGDPAATSHDEIIFCYPGLFAITVYRLAPILHSFDIPMLPRIMTEHAHSRTGIDIHPGATIGSHFFIDHGTGTVIGETTVIGKQVKIYQGVTLGGLSTRGGQSLRGMKRHPTIEDNVTIYAGASILGGDTVIGRNSVIGANAFITVSVPPCTTVTNQDQELRLTPRNCPGCEQRER